MTGGTSKDSCVPSSKTRGAAEAKPATMKTDKTSTVKTANNSFRRFAAARISNILPPGFPFQERFRERKIKFLLSASGRSPLVPDPGFPALQKSARRCAFNSFRKTYKTLWEPLSPQRERKPKDCLYFSMLQPQARQ
jgi:hypothetical protein